jgi:AcrR family transcriptional regulator
MKQDTRNLIIITASDLFYRKGYNLTGINEIIEKSGIAKATLYNHFKSKEELLIAYLDHKDEELIRSIKPFCNEKAKGNSRILAVLEFLIPVFNQDGFNGCWCIRSMAEIPRDNQRVRSKIKNSKINFRNFLKSLVSENKPELKIQEQNELADQVYLMYESAVTESHLHNMDWPIKAAISLLKDRLN